MELSPLQRFEVALWAAFLKKVSGFERKFVFLGVVRVVSLPITLFSVLIAGLLSLLYGGFRTDLFLADLFGLLLAHSASNVFNDIWDYKNKVDSPDYFRMKYNIHPVEVLGMKKSFLLGVLLSALAFICGLYLASERGAGVILLAFLGFIILFSYSGPPFKLKYYGMGEPVVFLVWGPLMIAGSFWVITGNLPVEIIIASFPYGITASLVLFGKHLDKIDEDRKKGVRTLPVILGEERTKKLWSFLIFLPYFFTLLFALMSGFYLTIFSFVSLPRAFRISKAIFEKKPEKDNLPEFYPKDFYPMWYVAGGFIFNTNFAVSFIAGLIFEYIMMS